jgi:molybdopterin-containing oxidoreductase family iron-sulfur binding subunit
MRDRTHIPLIPIDHAGETPDSASRRHFLKLMAASLALAGTGCSGPPAQQILPYVDTPERLAPGTPVFFASAFVHRGYAMGVLVECNEGRPTKVEGNVRHPSSMGATDVFMQASILDFWDPERAKSVTRDGQLSTWSAFDGALQSRRAQWERDGGAGLRLLSGSVTSPTLAGQLQALLARYPNARWHCHEPLHDDRLHQAARAAFGIPLDSQLHLERCRCVLALDCDLFAMGPASVRQAHDWFGARRDDPARRLYAVASVASATTLAADEQLIVPPARVEMLVWRLAAALGIEVPDAPSPSVDDEAISRWVPVLAKALQAQRGAALVAGGGCLSVPARTLIHHINAALGAPGRTVSYLPPAQAGATDHRASLAALAEDMRSGRVTDLAILDGNPAYDAPADLEFGRLLRGVAWSVHAGCHANETSRLCQWQLPASHVYEQWSDALAHDGSAAIVQPMMAPLYDSQSLHEIVARLSGADERDGYRLVRAFWQRRHPEDFEAYWQQALRHGILADTAPAPLAPTLAALPRFPAQPVPARDTLSLLFMRDASVDTGAFANNAWLQELPRPLSKLTWDNAAWLHPRAAAALELVTGDVVLITAAGGAASVEAPVWVTEDVAEGVLALPLGYGRTAAGQIGNGVGFDAFPLMTAADADTPAAARVRKTGRRHAFAVVQQQMQTHGRDIVRVWTLADLARQPWRDYPPEPQAGETLYPPVAYDDYKWGMAIDLGACIGCNACTVACQAENNIPVVGKEEVARGREMHWIRVDRYRIPGPRTGRPRDADAADRSMFQPVPCMHCENAPCEEVCPVGATVHDSEGLNVQVYNRCVGTRFCSNNCPYKVRRFNFLQYSDERSGTLAAQKNPDVTVRRRGVMEKCTYCVQRITRARLGAEKERRQIRDGEVVAACEAACPTQAIVFGNLNDPHSRVSRAKDSPLDYHLLGELNTRPRTSYRAGVVNRDPELE